MRMYFSGGVPKDGKLRWGVVRRVRAMTRGRFIVDVDHDDGTRATWPYQALVAWAESGPIDHDILLDLRRREWEERRRG